MTNYNLVIGVLCMFFYLVKSTLVLLHVFYPILSLPLHLALAAIWSYSIYLQTAPDTIDPNRQNHGAPWYIKKNCNIVDDKTIRQYCMQAKSAFAVSVIMLYVSHSHLSFFTSNSQCLHTHSVIYIFFILLSAFSLYPSKQARVAHATRRADKQAEKEKYASSPYDNEMTAEEQWQHMWELQQLPRTPGTAGFKHPMTPRTTAFQSLDGTQSAGVPAGGYYSEEIERGAPVQQEGYGYEGKGKANAY
jgi:hypothetical protein